MTSGLPIVLQEKPKPLLPDDLPDHPRLMARVGDWERIRKNIQSDPVSSQIYGYLQKKADKLLLEAPVERLMTGRRLLEVSREALDRIGLLAMVAKVSEDGRYHCRAINEMLAAADFSDWNPSHFLDTAEMALALAIGYDWLFEELSEEEKEKIGAALLEKGLRPSLEEEKLPFLNGASNWNQVCSAGLSAAAIAVADRDPVLAEKVLQRAVRGIVKVAPAYAPDGAYQEGPMYWDYGTNFHVVLADSLLRLTGDSRGIEKMPGFAGSADYMTQVTMPNGDFFPYADTNPTRPVLVPLFWFAREFDRPDWLEVEIKNMRVNLEKGKGSRLLALALLWRDPRDKAVAAQPLLHWKGDGLHPVAMHRSSFSDPNALYFGIKGGSPSLPHGHMDVGSFVLVADGEVWATDLGMQEYESLEKENVALWDGSPDGDRWKIFRLGPESHNILRFDGKHQVVTGRADFSLFRGEGDFPCSVLDLTGLYQGQVEAIRRGAMLIEGKAVLLQDEWVTGKESPETKWQMLTPAEVKVTEEGRILLSRHGRSLALHILDFDSSRMSIKIEEVGNLLVPLDAPVPGHYRISILVKADLSGKGLLRVFSVPGSSVGVVCPVYSKLSSWGEI